VAGPARILELLVSTDLGGGPAHVRDLVARLPRAEFEVTVGGPLDGPFAEVFRSMGIDVVEVPTRRLGPGPLRRLRDVIEDRAIDLVHSHGKGAGLYGRLAARRAGIAAVHTFHGIHVPASPPGAGAAYLALERWLARHSDALIHVSASQARAAARLRLGSEESTRLVVNGIDAARVAALAAERALPRRALGLDPERLVVGTVARFDPVKGLDVLVEAVARLATRSRVALLLVGDGPEGAALRTLVERRGLRGTVLFPGAVPDAARCLGAIDVYVSASRAEGLPLAVLEAMACRRPVVATRVPGHVDVIESGQSGVLVPPDDPDALARAVDELLREPARREALGEGARARVERDFSADRMAAQTAEVYRDALARHPRPLAIPGV